MSTGGIQSQGYGEIHVSFARRRLGSLALGGVSAIAWTRTMSRRRRVRRDRVQRRVAQGEVIIAFPEPAWRGSTANAARAAIELILRRFGSRWGVERRPLLFSQNPERDDRTELRGLSRTYICLTTNPGREDDVVRAVRVAAWRYRVPRGRFGLLVVRSPALRPAAPPDPPGTIEFTSDYDVAKAVIGADLVASKDITIMIVDVDPPDIQFLRPNVASRVDVLFPDGQPITDGHATLMTAVVGDIASEAKILTIATREKGVGYWGLLNILMTAQHVDLIVASVSIPQTSRPKPGRDRESFLDSTLQQRKFQSDRPPVLFPTGNAQSDERIDTLAIPARFEGAIAVGAVVVDEIGTARQISRSIGSRYGRKTAGDASAWWLAPGGAWQGNDVVRPLATMGGRPQAGTSIANAIAGGLAAGVIAGLRRQPATTYPGVEATLSQLEANLNVLPDAQESLAALGRFRDIYRGAITIDSVISELRMIATTDVITHYQPLEHGQGVLILQ